jgi:hypothetical protein
MTELEAMLQKLAHHRGAGPTWNVGTWVGPRPDVPPDQTANAIVATLGAAIGQVPRGDAKDYYRLSRDEAAAMLVRIATQSLAYGGFPQPPDPASCAQVKQRLSILADDATFLCNGDWHMPQTPRTDGEWTVVGSWLTMAVLGDATFEAAVIGFDADTAFIFWADEDD